MNDVWSRIVTWARSLSLSLSTSGYLLRICVSEYLPSFVYLNASSYTPHSSASPIIFIIIITIIIIRYFGPFSYKSFRISKDRPTYRLPTLPTYCITVSFLSLAKIPLAFERPKKIDFSPFSSTKVGEATYFIAPVSWCLCLQSCPTDTKIRYLISFLNHPSHLLNYLSFSHITSYIPMDLGSFNWFLWSRFQSMVNCWHHWSPNPPSPPTSETTNQPQISPEPPGCSPRYLRNGLRTTIPSSLYHHPWISVGAGF